MSQFPRSRLLAPCGRGRRALVFLLVPPLCLSLAAATAADRALVHIRHPLPLAGARRLVSRQIAGPTRRLLCNLHDDEQTSVQAARQLLARRHGRLVTLANEGTRNVTFSLGGRDVQFDPNRIFTAEGVRKTITELSSWDEEAQHVVSAFGQQLLRHYDLESTDVVVALHNNTEGRYAATSYAEGQEYDADAAAVHLAADQDADDFFFVTDQRFYDALSRRGYNVVLQDNQHVTDDGSLSVYCGQQGVPYVNVEAQHGHLRQQIAMLEALYEVLDRWWPERPDVADPTSDTSDGRPLRELELVDLHELDATLVIDARYATTDNVTGVRLYPRHQLYLERGAAERLVRVQKSLQSVGLGLKVFDAYRPLAVQRRLWEACPDPTFVADPAKGSRHNRAAAVDVTLVDAQGRELAMPTAFDEFSEKAHREYTELPADVIAHRDQLQQAMVAEGFEPLPSEWWHFDAPGWQDLPILDINPYPQPLFPSD